jgi:hypothetical protein
MNDQERSKTRPRAEQERRRDLWEEHVACEFVTRNTEDTLATIVDRETASKALNPRLPSNELIHRADQGQLRRRRNSLGRKNPSETSSA